MKQLVSYNRPPMIISKKDFFLFFLMIMMSCHSIVNGSDETETIVVSISSEESLNPLYLTAIQSKEAAYDESYSRQLDQVLSFDLSHNGSTYLLKRSGELDRLAISGSIDSVGDIAKWRQQNIPYVVTGRIQGKQLQLMIVDVTNNSLKRGEPILLTGDLNQDRRWIHRFADMLQKSLFNIEGVASTKILYSIKNTDSKDSKQWTSEIWEVDYDGANAHQMTFENSFCISPSYIPPKNGFLSGGFLYVSYKLGQPKIYIASLKGGEGHRLTYLRGNQLMPTLTMQRDKVAFISDITGNPDLFLQPFSPEVGALGKPQQIFSAKQATQSSPTFSPDGKKIAFVSDKDGAPKIYVIDIPKPGTSLKEIKATLITKRNRESSAPSWSPDGTKLAYCSKSKGERQIWFYDFTTNQEKQLTQSSGHKENPSWAPDSLHLVYNTADPSSSQLYILNLNQSEVTAITSGKGEKRFPNWEPRLK